MDEFIYAQRGPWYNVAHFRWTRIDKPIAAQIMIIIGLTNCEIYDKSDIKPDYAHTMYFGYHLRI